MRRACSWRAHALRRETALFLWKRTTEERRRHLSSDETDAAACMHASARQNSAIDNSCACTMDVRLRSFDPATHRSRATHCVESSIGASILAEPRRGASTVACLPLGTPVQCQAADAAETAGDWILVQQPVRGWALLCELAVPCAYITYEAACVASLYAAMQAARDDMVGSSDASGMCMRTSRRLLDLLEQSLTLQAALSALNLWPVEYRHARFCSPPDRDFARWHAHAYLLFADGTIADCTSDQFGGPPRLAWPADVRRYSTVASGQWPITTPQGMPEDGARSVSE